MEKKNFNTKVLHIKKKMKNVNEHDDPQSLCNVHISLDVHREVLGGIP